MKIIVDVGHEFGHFWRKSVILAEEGSRGFGVRMATPALNYHDYETPVLSRQMGEG